MLTDLDEMRQRPVVVRIAIIIGSILRGKFAEFNGANIFFLQITAKMEEISPENWGRVAVSNSRSSSIQPSSFFYKTVKAYTV